jgi:hypothetical protein
MQEFSIEEQLKLIKEITILTIETKADFAIIYKKKEYRIYSDKEIPDKKGFLVSDFDKTYFYTKHVSEMIHKIDSGNINDRVST